MNERLSLRAYQLPKGRPERDVSPLNTKTIHVPFLYEDYMAFYEDCKELDVMASMGGGGPVYLTDYVRAGMLLFHFLLQGPSRERALAFANLDRRRWTDLKSHLVYRIATLPHPDDEHHVAGVPENPAVDPNLHASMYRDEEEIGESHDPNEAPLTERDPWNQL
jgi:hypothetical protein